MALSTTIKKLKDLLVKAVADLEKADNGNKAASQRVRTGTVKLEKIAKLYRKESIKEEKKPGKKKKKKAPAKKKKAVKKKVAKKKAPAKKKKVVKKKATAKLPKKKKK